MKKYIMALDQGTTSSRCILFDENEQICSIAQKEFAQHYPNPGWVEHDPMEIWSSQLSVAIEAMAKVGADGDSIVSIGITNQRETAIVWDRRSGKPVYPAIVWQCRRTSEQIEQIERDGMTDTIREKTGLIPDSYFSATKIQWILNHVEGARQEAEAGNLLFGTVDTWLIWNLTGGQVHATDYTNASRTMLFNIHDLVWDRDLLAYFDIPDSMLPKKVLPSGSLYGYTKEDTVFGRPIAIGGVAGDQQAALFGQGCFAQGDVKNTYGTGCFLLMNTGKEAVHSEHGLLTTIAAGTEEKPDYVLEGSVFVAGAAIQWLRDGLRMFEKAADSESYAVRAGDSKGVYVVPAFTGLGAPYWNPYARGMIVGLTRGTTKEELIRATLESIAYQTETVIDSMEKDANLQIDTLRVDGGASANDFLMQFQSDISDVRVVRPACIESTALGAARLAGLTAGFYEKERMRLSEVSAASCFSPVMSGQERERSLKGWKRAVSCALLWAEE